jgi:hypothetical protein
VKVRHLIAAAALAAAVVVPSATADAATCSGGYVDSGHHQAYKYCYASTLPSNARYYLWARGNNGVYYYGAVVRPGYTSMSPYVSAGIASYGLVFV